MLLIRKGPLERSMRIRDTSQVFISWFYSWLVKLPPTVKSKLHPESALCISNYPHLNVCVSAHGLGMRVNSMSICVCVKVRKWWCLMGSGGQTDGAATFRLMHFKAPADICRPAAVSTWHTHYVAVFALVNNKANITQKSVTQAAALGGRHYLKCQKAHLYQL